MATTLVELLNLRSQQLNQSGYTFLENGELEGETLNYCQLHQRAQAIAACLQTQTVPGDRVLLLYPPGLEFICAFFGCLYAGVIAVPIYPPRANQRLLRVLAISDDTDACLALTSSSLKDKVLHQFQREPSLINLPCLATDTLQDIDDWKPVKLEADTPAFLQYTSGSTGYPKGVILSHHNILSNQQMIKVAFEHDEMTCFVGWLPLFHDMGLIGNIVQPLYLGTSCVLMSPAAFLQQPIRWLKAISRYQAATSGGPNFAYDLCIQQIQLDQFDPLDLSCWTVAFNGSEPVRAKTLEQFTEKFKVWGFQRTAFFPCYGLAEATLFVAGASKHQPPQFKSFKTEALMQHQAQTIGIAAEQVSSLVSCGSSALGQTLRIVDPETKIPCSSGNVGEIWVAGSHIAQGYWQQPEVTEDCFQAYCLGTHDPTDLTTGPFLRTGDLGFLDNGYLYVTGRLKDLIIIRGRNYYPQDIELTVQESHPALSLNQGAAFEIDIADTPELIIVQEVTRPAWRELKSHPEVIKPIFAAIRQAIAEHFELQVYSIVLIKPTTLSQTSSGKVQRYACRSKYLDHTLEIVGQWHLSHEVKQHSPSIEENIKQVEDRTTFKPLTQGDIEAWLCQQLSHRLRLPPHQIDVSKPLATYGLDSAVAITVTGELEQWLGCDLDPAFLFWEYPTVKELAEYLVGQATYSDSIELIQ